MAKKDQKTTKKQKKPRFQKSKHFFESRQTQTIIGLFFILFGFFLISAFISFLFNW